VFSVGFAPAPAADGLYSTSPLLSINVAPQVPPTFVTTSGNNSHSGGRAQCCPVSVCFGVFCHMCVCVCTSQMSRSDALSRFGDL